MISHTKSTTGPRHLSATAIVIAAATAAALLAGCSSSSDSSSDPSASSSGGGSKPKDPLAAPAAGGTVVVGSNNFAESILLMDVYGEALKAKGVKVSYQPNIGTREVSYGLLKNGSVTVLPEFNGSLLAYLDKSAAPTSAQAATAAIEAKLDPKLTMLDPAAAEDKDSVTINAATAAKYHLTSQSTIADLAKVGSQIVVGGSPEFQTRQQGLVGLKSEYGLVPKSFKPLDAGGPLTVAALKNNNVQAADVFSTDASVAREKFVVLQDPKKLFGFANVQPLVSKAGLPAAGVAALNAVSAKLDTKTLLDLDNQVQNQKKDPLDVAQAWLKSVGLS
ncbi:ABC transporter substrate-binding protein [Actinacidiphila paucisporea]|uniref:Osmoprotectant transport system substrate-binding protein n=1 Tax=Actinacidiphila paucisporea TaxID=310782 RepID=A0A1M7NHI9_9ACTN|nr:ABC transporter substrate-binding protein [Actinacidiphila paucisporea]SHN02957.1 osmoprotectant transport system substrate-binding protein [Actinacidiphila paucisporea]